MKYCVIYYENDNADVVYISIIESINRETVSEKLKGKERIVIYNMEELNAVSFSEIRYTLKKIKKGDEQIEVFHPDMTPILFVRLKNVTNFELFNLVSTLLKNYFRDKARLPGIVDQIIMKGSKKHDEESMKLILIRDTIASLATKRNIEPASLGNIMLTFNMCVYLKHALAIRRSDQIEGIKTKEDAMNWWNSLLPELEHLYFRGEAGIEAIFGLDAIKEWANSNNLSREIISRLSMGCYLMIMRFESIAQYENNKSNQFGFDDAIYLFCMDVLDSPKNYAVTVKQLLEYTPKNDSMIATVEGWLNSTLNYDVSTRYTISPTSIREQLYAIKNSQNPNATKNCIEIFFTYHLEKTLMPNNLYKKLSEDADEYDQLDEEGFEEMFMNQIRSVVSKSIKELGNNFKQLFSQENLLAYVSSKDFSKYIAKAFMVKIQPKDRPDNKLSLFADGKTSSAKQDTSFPSEDKNIKLRSKG